MIGGTGFTRAPCATWEKLDSTNDMPQRPVGDAFHRPAIERGDGHRHQKHDQQDDRDGGEAKGDQHEEGDEGDEAADHENIAMSEIDHADDAVDHRVADGDQATDRAKHQAVDELLSEIIHGLRLTGPRTVLVRDRRDPKVSYRTDAARATGSLERRVLDFSLNSGN